MPIMRAEACSGKALASPGVSEAVVALKPSVPGIHHVPIAAFCFTLWVSVRLMWMECQPCLSQLFICLVALFQMDMHGAFRLPCHQNSVHICRW